jgi:hypothetical protein
VIRIDVHSTGENSINTTRTLPTSVHVRLAYASSGQSPYVETFHESSTDLDRSHCSWEKGSRHNPQHNGWPIRRSVPSLSLKPTNEIVDLSQTSVDDKLLGLLAHIISMRLVRSILAHGANPSVLNKFYQLNRSLSLKGPKAATRSSGHSAIYRNLHLRLAITNNISLALGFTRIDRRSPSATRALIQLL